MTDSLKTGQIKKPVLYDIEIKDIKSDTVSIFKQFRSEQEIGTLIAKDYMAYSYRATRKDLEGFFLSEDDKGQIGLLTQCYGLETMYTLYTYGIDIQPYKDRILRAIRDILARTENNVFRPTPYIVQEFEDREVWGDAFVDAYNDSVINVLTAMCQMRELLYSETLVEDSAEFDELMDQVENSIIQCIKILNDSAITTGENPPVYKIEGVPIKNVVTGDEKIQYCGWNFAPASGKDVSEYEPSLYFTYVTTMGYMILKTLLSDAIDVHRDEVRKTERFSEEDFERFRSSDKFNRDTKFLNKFVKDFDLWNAICIDAGHYIDMKLTAAHLDFSEDLIGTGYVKADFKDISNSTTNDALFNSLFCIGILINSGADLDYLDYSMERYGDVSRQIDFIERMQYGIQNIQKYYKQFELNDKEYIINQFVLNFNELLPANVQAQAKVLRKQKITPTSFDPLLIKTYFMISKYLVKYPQKQSVAYLKSIMANRVESSKYTWLWDKDGYNIISNYMYVDALKEFYDYYNEYELAYSGNISEQIKQKDAEFKKTLDDIQLTHESTVEKLQAQIEKLQKDIEQLESAENPFLRAIDNYLDEYLGDKLPKAVQKQLKQIFDENVEGDGTTSPITTAFNNAIISWFSETYRSLTDEFDLSKERAIKVMRDSIDEFMLREVKNYDMKR